MEFVKLLRTGAPQSMAAVLEEALRSECADTGTKVHRLKSLYRIEVEGRVFTCNERKLGSDGESLLESELS